MLRRLIALLVLMLVAGTAASPIDGGRAVETAISGVLLADASNGSAFVAIVSGQELAEDGLGDPGNNHCLHTLTIPRSAPAAEPAATCERLRWTYPVSFLTQVRLPPSHPPPDSAA